MLNQLPSSSVFASEDDDIWVAAWGQNCNWQAVQVFASEDDDIWVAAWGQDYAQSTGKQFRFLLQKMMIFGWRPWGQGYAQSTGK